MKKCLVMALGLCTYFAARAEITLDVSIARSGKETITKTCALNEVAQFDEAGISASLVATEKDGAVFLSAQCSRVMENGETRVGEISDVALEFNTAVMLVQTEEVTVTVVARNTVCE